MDVLIDVVGEALPYLVFWGSVFVASRIQDSWNERKAFHEYELARLTESRRRLRRLYK